MEVKRKVHIDFKYKNNQYYVKQVEDEMPIVTIVGKETFTALSEKVQFEIFKRLEGGRNK